MRVPWALGRIPGTLSDWSYKYLLNKVFGKCCQPTLSSFPPCDYANIHVDSVNDTSSTVLDFISLGKEVLPLANIITFFTVVIYRYFALILLKRRPFAALFSITLEEDREFGFIQVILAIGMVLTVCLLRWKNYWYSRPLWYHQQRSWTKWF